MSDYQERDAALRITSTVGAIQKVYDNCAPEKDNTEAIAWAIAALAESNLAIARSNLAIASAIREARERHA